MLYYSAMRQTLLILATVACAALTGCFDNHGRPQDATPVTSLAALAATNRAEVVHLYLRGGTEPLAKGTLADLPRLRELDLSERALAAVPEEVFALPSLERFWFARNQLAECPAALAKLPGYTRGGPVSATCSPFKIAGTAWNAATTYYYSPRGGITTGDKVDEMSIEAGTFIFYKKK